MLSSDNYSCIGIVAECLPVDISNHLKRYGKPYYKRSSGSNPPFEMIAYKKWFLRSQQFIVPINLRVSLHNAFKYSLHFDKIITSNNYYSLVDSFFLLRASTARI